MANYSIHFSPAGGTKRTADVIATGFGSYESIDLTNRKTDFSDYEFSSEDLVLISMPAFRGRAPELALARLKEMEGNGAKAVLNAVYGNREFEDTLVEMADCATAAGFHIVCAIASIAEHSQLPQFAEGRPDKQDRDLLTFFGKMAYGKVQSGDFTTPEFPGNRPYKEVTYTIVPPMTDDSCENCGKCSKKCPAGAIDMKDPSKIDASLCILCTRCIHLCPKGAKHLDALGLEKLRERLQETCSKRKSPELHI